MRDDPFWSARFFFLSFFDGGHLEQIGKQISGMHGHVCVRSKTSRVPPLPTRLVHTRQEEWHCCQWQCSKNLHGTISTSLLIYKTRRLALRMWKDSGASRPWINQPSGKVILCIGSRLSFQPGVMFKDLSNCTERAPPLIMDDVTPDLWPQSCESISQHSAICSICTAAGTSCLTF